MHPDVDAIIEAIVWDNARPEDPWSDPAIRWTSQDMHQVDVTPMENALDDLCQTLRLNTSYTLFLMNPKLPYPDFNYGYRFGLSNAELDRLHENVTLVEELHRRPPVRPHFVMSDDLVQDAHVLGAALFSPVFSTVRGGASAYVSDLWVAPEARGQALGTAQLAAVAERTRIDWNASFIKLVSYSNNNEALRFYARLGFASLRGETGLTLSGAPLAALAQAPQKDTP